MNLNKLLPLLFLVTPFATLTAGLSWTGRTIASGRPDLQGVAYGASKFVTLDETTDGSFRYGVSVSGNGLSWQTHLSGPHADLLAGNGNSVVAADYYTNSIYTSADGVKFSRDNRFPTGTIELIDTLTFSDKAYAGTGRSTTDSSQPPNYIFLGSETATPGKITWLTKKLALPMYRGEAPFPIGVASSGKISAGGAGVKLVVPAFLTDTIFGIYCSSNFGRTWSLAKNLGTDSVFAIRYLHNQFVGVGLGGSLYTSTDGMRWTKRSLPSANPSSLCLNDVAYGKSTFVVVGSRRTGASTFVGVIFSSFDGARWTENTLPSGWPEVDYVAFGANHFVAAGSKQGAVLQSN